MDVDEVIDQVAALEGVLTLRPQPGDGSPEISWGDAFFYYAPDGQVPNGQPFATVVTKAYPDEEAPWLDRPGTFRLNIAVGRDAMATVLGQDADRVPEAGAPDTLVAHPVYGDLGWVAVTNPGERAGERALTLVRSAHARARARRQRRDGGAQD
ncbi:hypothetical protein SAMN04488543_2172 [Friedmanniella luteola]|uniref:DUF6194 domain-containing protein n=1 Tax=Friedmanniella luteola TaxID=546871 RepID=A0A1H1U6C0_9ACTN|nr:DUF6194 family protein [Friedmanniella luteola]SDS67796.1 hypothetical protein SAMN04488543_2172 [Friedmanniella luteola]